MKRKIDFSRGQFFKPRVKHKTVWMFYAVYAIFFVAGLFMLYVEGTEVLSAVIAMYSLVSFMFILVWLQTSAILIKYYVGPQGIFLRRSWKKELFPFTDIKDLVKVNESEVERIASELDKERTDNISETDIIGAFKAQMDFGSLIQYSSVQFVGKEIGSDRHRISVGVNTDGDFLLLKLKDNRKFLISPENMDLFLEQARSFIKHAADS